MSEPVRISNDPVKVGIAGDWHGNTKWACHAIEQMAPFLKDEKHPVIIHLGDFGFYPGKWGDSFLTLVTETLEKHNITLWAIDGNHENHPWLKSKARKLKEENLDMPGLFPDACVYPITANIAWMSRGFRMTIHDKEWLFLGGAASLDREYRQKLHENGGSESWWPEEVISREEADRVMSTGHADVMITHECPSIVTHSFPDFGFSHKDIAYSQEHSELLTEIVFRVKPSYLIHGHLHRTYERPVETSWGTLRVTGLDCDGTKYNWAILDTKTMNWVGP